MPSFVVEESSNSVKVFWLDQESLLREIHKVAREVGNKNENVLKIVLFGSLTEKTAVPGSDADILIVLRAYKKPFIDRMGEWLEKFAIDFPVEIFPYTEEELNNSFASQAMRTGITLFERSKANGNA
ncbi:MAG: nucleotidyltransferase domain-containing protein [Chloroflexota bacterium]